MQGGKRLYEIEMSAMPGPSRGCRFGKTDKLFQPSGTMKLVELSIGLRCGARSGLSTPAEMGLRFGLS
jgi:hypothetical protein